MIYILAIAALTLVAGPPGPPPTEEATVTYVEALTTSDPTPALAVSAAGSAAWRYAEGQSAGIDALTAAGDPLTDEVTVRDDGVQSCRSDQFGQSECATFAGWVTDADGLITSLTVDGTSIDGRVGDPSEPVTVGPITASVRSSYHSIQSDALIVTVLIETTADVEVSGGFGAAYITPDGAQLSVVDAVGPSTQFAGTNATVLLGFSAADPGGRVVWEVFAGECCDSYRLDLPVPVLGEGVPVDMTPVTTTVGS